MFLPLAVTRTAHFQFNSITVGQVPEKILTLYHDGFDYVGAARIGGKNWQLTCPPKTVLPFNLHSHIANKKWSSNKSKRANGSGRGK